MRFANCACKPALNILYRKTCIDLYTLFPFLLPIYVYSPFIEPGDAMVISEQQLVPVPKYIKTKI